VIAVVIALCAQGKRAKRESKGKSEKSILHECSVPCPTIRWMRKARENSSLM
jgi:hypothetical protein